MNVMFRLLVVVKRIVKKPTVIHEEYFIIVIPEESDIMVMGLEGILMSCIKIFPGLPIITTPIFLLGMLDDFLAPLVDKLPRFFGQLKILEMLEESLFIKFLNVPIHLICIIKFPFQWYKNERILLNKTTSSDLAENQKNNQQSQFHGKYIDLMDNIISNNPLIKMEVRKPNQVVQWRENNHSYYDFIYENILDWPVTSVQWGPLLQQNSEFSLQRLYFSCKTDGTYMPIDNSWTNTPNYIVMANVEIPNEEHYYINDLRSLFNYDAAKKHPNLKVKQIISHPGEITVIRSSPMNRKLLASKSDNNMVYLWTSDKYKLGTVNNTPSTPDMILMATKSERHNYALRFTPSLPKIISASADKLELFDIEGAPVKRELGSMLSTNVIKPVTVLEGHDKVEDVAFKNNELCITGGQDKQIGVWDLRISCLCHKIGNIHESDINAIGCKGNYIVSGGEEGRFNIIDERNYKVVERFELEKPIHGIQFNPATNHFAIGREHLEIYDLSKIIQERKMEPLFKHLGMKGNIHQFDWNNQSSMTLATTYQESDIDLSAQGGFIHVFKPLDIFFQKKAAAIEAMKAAFEKLSPEQKAEIMARNGGEKEEGA